MRRILEHAFPSGPSPVHGSRRGRGGERCLGPALLLVALGGLAPAAHDPAHDPADPDADDPSHAGVGVGDIDPLDRAYYLGLFAHLVADTALGDGGEYVRGVGQLALDEMLLQRAEALYAELRERLPVVSVTWNGSEAALASSPVIHVARGVERTVLVEVLNLDVVAHPLSASFPGTSLSNVALTQRGFVRGLVCKLRVDDPETQRRVLTIRSATRRDAVHVPVQTYEPAVLVGTVEDADLDQPLAARVSVLGSDGEYRHGSAFRGIPTLSRRRVPRAAPRTYKLPEFYADGSFEVEVPPGRVELTMERGLEFRRKTLVGQLLPGETRTVRLSSRRFVDMRSRGWVSGETHVHWVKDTFFENEDIDLLGVVQRAEDIQVVNNLTLRHRNQIHGVEWIRPDHAPMGPVPGHDVGPYRIQMGQEYRNDPFYGHLNFLNLIAPPAPLASTDGATRRGLIMPVSTGDLIGPFAEDYPVNYSRIDAALRQRPPEARPLIVSAHGIAGEVPADVALGRIDSLDQIRPTDYYRFLDCGFRIPLTDGADFPAGPVGKTRCYARIEGAFSYGAWIDGILSGRTFVTSGPMLWMTVDGEDIGASLSRASGDTVSIHVEAHARDRIGRLQVLSNHEFLYDAQHDGSSAILDLDLPADVSRWIVARCSSAEPPTYRPFQEPGAAHTSAVYLGVDGKRVFVDSGAAQYLRNLCQDRGDDVYENGLFAAPGAEAKRAEARDCFFAGRDVYQALIDSNP